MYIYTVRHWIRRCWQKSKPEGPAGRRGKQLLKELVGINRKKRTSGISIVPGSFTRSARERERTDLLDYTIEYTGGGTFTRAIEIGSCMCIYKPSSFSAGICSRSAFALWKYLKDIGVDVGTKGSEEWRK